MTVTLGTGRLSYEPVAGWGKLPQGWSFRECAGVAVDSHDRVYVFTRGEHPVIIFDREGKFLNSWGAGVFSNAHGITLGPDDSVYCVDNGDHTVRKFTPEGKLLLTIGSKGRPAGRWSGDPLNLPTHLAVSSKTGELYVSDGYGNSRVHKYSPDGRHILSWGAPGIDPGQFVIPHNIAIDKDDNVYVADRENHRIQIFDSKGGYQTMWSHIWKACGICVDAAGTVYVGELGADRYIADAPGVGHRVSILDRQGKLLARIGQPNPGEGPGQFLAPHGVAVDSRGSIYVAEVSWTMVGQHLDGPREMRSLQKLTRKA